MTDKARILALLKGLATGDVIGKQTENLSRDEMPAGTPMESGATASVRSVSSVVSPNASRGRRGRSFRDTRRTGIVEANNGHGLADYVESLSALRA